MCSKCFYRDGFMHNCNDGTLNIGPFPNLEQEAAVLALFDAQLPPRSSNDLEQHTGAW
jgi:hypothetical protein